MKYYRQNSNIRCTLVGTEIVDHSDVVVSALLQLHLHARLNTWVQWIGPKTTARWDETHLSFGIGAPYIRDMSVLMRHKSVINFSHASKRESLLPHRTPTTHLHTRHQVVENISKAFTSLWTNPIFFSHWNSMAIKVRIWNYQPSASLVFVFDNDEIQLEFQILMKE